MARQALASGASSGSRSGREGCFSGVVGGSGRYRADNGL
jgi:hypothetical protein